MRKTDCILIGFNDETMETTIRRIEPYKQKGAAYYHMRSRSVIIDGKRKKFSEAVNESISTSTGYHCDLSIYRMPNMATHYLSQYLEKRGISTEIVNNYNLGKEKLRKLLRENNPLVVGVSSTCLIEAAPIREVVDFIRKNNQDAVIVVGGPFINSINYEYIDQQQQYLLSRMGADIYIHERQGERTLYQLCCELMKNNPCLSDVPNILYRQGRAFARTKKVPENIPLDEDPVKKLTFYEGHPIPPVYVRTALSCSMNCAFCRYPILGGEPIYMSLDGIERNLDYIHSLGVRSIVFIDDSFNLPIERYKAILKLMIKKKYHFSWYSFFRISHADEEAIMLMAESGCKGVLLGVESGNNTILKNMDKQVTKEKLMWGIQELKKHNIITYASCMIGFPGETLSTAKDTIAFIEECSPDFFDLQCWFCENAVPIAKEKDYYSLEGYGYSWKHKDMDSDTAAKLVSEAIKSIKNSCFMPSLSFNLWSLAYYLTQGATINEIKEFCRIFSSVVDSENNELDETYHQQIHKLLHVFSGNKELHENLRARHNLYSKEQLLEKEHCS